jgi:hypothetical protein
VTPVHHAAAQGFARAASEYGRGRPGYPQEAIEHIARRLHLAPGRAVADLAAGTGALTRPLLALGCEVAAVDPVAEMRAELPDGATVLDGTAERIPLADGSADAVTVAQASTGSTAALALLWNRRVAEDPVNAALEELVGPHRAATPSERRGDWRTAFERTTLFSRLEERAFANEQTLDADGMADRVASISFIASLPAEERGRVVAGARKLTADGPLTIPYRTEVLVCGRRG